MYFHSIDHRKDSPNSKYLVHRGFWLNGTPRLTVRCRLLGHRPVVDGTAGIGDRPGSRWICCDRCGVRPEPQGNLDPEQWDIGQRYGGEFLARDLSPLVREQLAKRGHTASLRLPGSWPAKPTGVLGGELVIGRPFSSGFSMKVGNCGSEQTLAGRISIWPLGSLYLHTEDHGTWIQRRLNPVGYDSRVIEVTIADKRLTTSLWANRNERSKSDPWWMNGSVRIDPRDIILGAVRNSWENIGDPVTATVRMPEGDEHEVQVTLQKWATGRKHGRKRISWRADWTSKPGIPFRNHPWKGDEVFSSTADVTFDAVHNGRWTEEACAQIAADISRDRARYNYSPEPAVTGPAPDHT